MMGIMYHYVNYEIYVIYESHIYILQLSGWWFQLLWTRLVSWEYDSQYVKNMFQTTNQYIIKIINTQNSELCIIMNTQAS